MKHPNFFIIGAPKCGTTSMAAWLSEHPQIFMSDPKEVNFFNTDHDMGEFCHAKTPEQYSRIFKNAENEYLAVGEASATYLLSHVAVKNIVDFDPAAKFIVMLRSPLDMAPSFHGELLWEGWECIEDFERAWLTRNTREFGLGKVGPVCSDLALLHYENVCKIGTQVERLLKTVDGKTVLFTVLDDIVLDPLHEYQRVLKFLDVPYDGKTEFHVHNARKHVKSRLVRNAFWYIHKIKQGMGIPPLSTGAMKYLHDFNMRSYERAALRLEFKMELIEVFKDDILLLSSIVGHDFSHWLRVQP